MSLTGTHRLYSPARNLFRCWRLTGCAGDGACPSQFDPKATSATTKKAALFPDLASSDLLAENVPSTPRRRDRAGDARGTQFQR